MQTRETQAKEAYRDFQNYVNDVFGRRVRLYDFAKTRIGIEHLMIVFESAPRFTTEQYLQLNDYNRVKFSVDEDTMDQEVIDDGRTMLTANVRFADPFEIEEEYTPISGGGAPSPYRPIKRRKKGSILSLHTLLIMALIVIIVMLYLGSFNTLTRWKDLLSQ